MSSAQNRPDRAPVRSVARAALAEVSASQTSERPKKMTAPPNGARRPYAPAMRPESGEARMIPKKNEPYTSPIEAPSRSRETVAARCDVMIGRPAIAAQ